MEKTNFREIPLEEITPSPMNPRKDSFGDTYKGLVESIRQKGVIEPIIIRPIKGKLNAYEIVVGERRFRGAGAAELKTIPAVVRELTNDEAYDFILIENLQREDLTDREEAESFKAYIGRHGDGAIPDLAEKTGIPQAYIRSRVRVLELPAQVIKAWEEGKLCFGHLHQLLRIGEKTSLEDTIRWIFEQLHWQHGMTIEEIRSHIDDRAPALCGAFFKAKDICAVCHSNSIVQKDLFDVETKGAHCLNPACFKKFQAEWLAVNWKSTEIAKKEGTNGFRFHEDRGRDDIHNFYDWGKQHLGKKCASCPDFVSVIEISGKVDQGKACAGNKSCYDTIKNPKSEKEKATGEKDPEAPRAAWHGEYFRDVFLSKRIPEVLAGIDPDDPKIKALLLVCAIHGNQSIIRTRNSSAAVLVKPTPELRKAFKAVIEKVILSGQHVGDTEWNGFGTAARRRVAEYLGIDLAKEFTVDNDYLAKKTRAEVLAFIKKFKLLPIENVAKLKKKDLDKAVLALGTRLIGKVPAEVLGSKS